jgi:hypothetical protein
MSRTGGKRVASSVALVAMIAFLSLSNLLESGSSIPERVEATTAVRSVPEALEEKSERVEATTAVRTYLVQPQENLSGKKKSASLSIENHHPPLLRPLAAESSSTRKEQVKTGRLSSSAKTSEVASTVQMRVNVTTKLSRELGRMRPRILFLEGSPWTTNHTAKTLHVLYNSEMKGDAAYKKPMVTKRAQNCVPLQDWQATFRPACNVFHATSLEDSIADNRLQMLGRGTYRVGLKITHRHNDTPAVWKTSK